jgi:predicted flavoprotein YhiN
MREAVEGSKRGDESSQSQHADSVQRAQKTVDPAVVTEAEAKRAEEAEHSQKQAADARHAARARLADELTATTPSPTEKAPLLSAHQRYGGVSLPACPPRSPTRRIMGSAYAQGCPL